MTDTDQHPPRLGPLPPDVEDAARMISPVIWNQHYRLNEGPIHHAGGNYWHDTLLDQADRWEVLASAARLVARVMPHD